MLQVEAQLQDVAVPLVEFTKGVLPRRQAVVQQQAKREDVHCRSGGGRTGAAGARSDSSIEAAWLKTAYSERQPRKSRQEELCQLQCRKLLTRVGLPRGAAAAPDQLLRRLPAAAAARADRLEADLLGHQALAEAHV